MTIVDIRAEAGFARLSVCVAEKKQRVILSAARQLDADRLLACVSFLLKPDAAMVAI